MVPAAAPLPSDSEPLPEPELVEAIARRVVELLRAEPAPPSVRYVDASEIARLCGVDRSWVYAHAGELGAIRLGDGPRARLRFDPQRVAAELAARAQVSPAPAPAPQPRPRTRRRRAPADVVLLPIRGEPPQ